MPARYYSADDTTRTMSLYPVPADPRISPYEIELGTARPVDDRQRDYDPYREAPYGDAERYRDHGVADRSYDRDDLRPGRERAYGLDRGRDSGRGGAGRGRDDDREGRGRISAYDRDVSAYDPGQVRDRSYAPDRGRGADRGRAYDRDRGYDTDRERGYDRDHDGDRDRGFGRDRGYGRDDRDRDRDRGHDRDRGRDDRGRGDRDRGRDREDRRPAAPPRAKDNGTASKRAPLMIRGTLAAGALLALAASLVRAGAGGGFGGNGQATLVLGQGTTASAIQTAPVNPAAGGMAQAVGAQKMGAQGMNAQGMNAQGMNAQGMGAQAAGAQGMAGLSCEVRYTVTARTGTTFNAVLTVLNTGATDVTGWTLRWRYPTATRVSAGSNATVTSTTQGAQARSVATNRRIPAGGSTTIGFVGTLPAGTAAQNGAGMADPTQPATTGFSLNGVMCR